MEIVPIPLDAIAGAAALFAVLVAGITQVTKKLGACDSHVIYAAIVSGQLLSMGWTLANGKTGLVDIYLGELIAIAATLTAMGLWQVIKPPPTS